MDRPKHEWKRFEIIDKSREDALIALLDEKDISRADLILILRTIRFNPNFDPRIEDVRGHYIRGVTDLSKNT